MILERVSCRRDDNVVVDNDDEDAMLVILFLFVLAKKPCGSVCGCVSGSVCVFWLFRLGEQTKTKTSLVFVFFGPWFGRLVWLMILEERG